MNQFLFSYGTLQQPEVQKRLFGRTLSGRPDKLDGYKISTIKISDKDFVARGDGNIQKTLVPTGICGDFVEGIALELSEDELQIVAEYEPKSYKRMSVQLESGTKAWIYLAAYS